jgi:hypothetical protein
VSRHGVEARCQARGGRGIGVKHAVVSDVSVSDTVLRRGCQARGGVGRGVGYVVVSGARVSGTRWCQARGGRDVEARVSGARRCQVQDGGGVRVSGGCQVRGVRGAGVKHTAVSGCAAVSDMRVLSARRWLGVGVRRSIGRGCQAHGCQVHGVRYGVGRVGVVEARVSSTRWCQTYRCLTRC